MRTKPLITGMIMATLFITQLYSQKAKSDDSQLSKELEETEKKLDKKIVDMNKEFTDFYSLKGKDVNYSPAQTRFRQAEDYIELESYSFINHTRNTGEVVGMKSKIMRLYYSGNSLKKIETTVIEENFQQQTKIENKVVDPSPQTEDSQDIEITNIFNDGRPITVALKSMQNTISNPLRIKFKREFYLKNLAYFQKMYTYTIGYQARYGTSTTDNLIEDLKKSLAGY
ncbi:MAG: hypothetical protein OEZ13_07810 [Spirochaetia bacterium]|nr:hypothetical protein [Spirochaetia bacterium]